MGRTDDETTEGAAAELPSAPDRLTRRVIQVADAAGKFIEYWGFKAIHGRIWTLLALRGRPMAQSEIVQLLDVSRSLVSSTISDLAELGLVRSTGPQRNAPWEAVIDVWPVIADVLRRREWMLIEEARVALEAAIEEAELRRQAGEPVGWDLARMQLLMGMTEMAQSFLGVIIRMRVPKALDGLGSLVGKAASVLGRLRGLGR